MTIDRSHGHCTDHREAFRQFLFGSSGHLGFTPSQFENFPQLRPEQAVQEYMNRNVARAIVDGQEVFLDKRGGSVGRSNAAVRFANMLLAHEVTSRDISVCVKPSQGIPAAHELLSTDTQKLIPLAFAVSKAGNAVPVQDPCFVLPLKMATFYSGSSLRWNSEFAASASPFQMPDGSPVVPLVGPLYWQGYPLTNEQVFPEALKPVHEPSGCEATQLGIYWGSRSLVFPSNTEIRLRRCGINGLEVPSEPLPADSIDAVTVPVCAFQFVGIGVCSYTHHFGDSKVDRSLMPRPPGEMPLLAPQETLATNSGRTTQPRNWGRSGIFLEQQHQGLSTAPTGGCTEVDETMRLEAALLREGARIGALTVGYCTLASTDDLNSRLRGQTGIPHKDIHAQVKAITSINVRSSRIIGDDDVELTDEIGLENQLALVAVVEAIYGEFNSTNLHKYLLDNATNRGDNVRAFFKSGVTHHPEDRVANNLCALGELCDVENCIVAKHPADHGFAVYRNIFALLRLAKVVDIGWDDFIQGEVISQFVTRCTNGTISKLDTSVLYQHSSWKTRCLRAAAWLTGKALASLYEESGRHVNINVLRENIGRLPRERTAIISSADLNEIMNTSVSTVPTHVLYSWYARYFEILFLLKFADQYDEYITRWT